MVDQFKLAMLYILARREYKSSGNPYYKGVIEGLKTALLSHILKEADEIYLEIEADKRFEIPRNEKTIIEEN